MTKFYIKQKYFSIQDKYRIFSKDEEELYYAKKRMFIDHLGLIRKYDEKEVFFIKREYFHFLPKYVLYRNHEQVAAVKMRFSIFTSKFDIESKYGDFQVYGDWLSHDFSISLDGDEKARIHKMYLSFGDCYEIIINALNNEEKEFYLALVLMIDNCIHNNKNNN